MSSSTAAAGFPPLSTALKTDTNSKAAVREFIPKCELGYMCGYLRKYVQGYICEYQRKYVQGYICGYLRKYMHGSIRNYVL